MGQKSKANEMPLLDNFLNLKTNGYEKVAGMLPDSTEISEDFIGIIARIELLRSPDFHELLQKLQDQDPKVLAMMSNPTITHISEISPAHESVKSGSFIRK